MNILLAGLFLIAMPIVVITFPYHFLTRCLDVFIVAYLLGKNGIKGKYAKWVCFSFGLFAYLMAETGILVKHSSDTFTFMFVLTLLPPLCSVIIYIAFKNYAGFFEQLNLSKILFLVLVSFLTSIDVFCSYHFLYDTPTKFFISADVISAIAIGYYAINLYKRHADDKFSMGCIISILFVWYYFLWFVVASFRLG